MTISLTATVTTCTPQENVFTLVLASTAVVGGDHIAVIDFTGQPGTVGRAGAWKVNGVTVTGDVAFLFTSAAETYTLELTVAHVNDPEEKEIERSVVIILDYTVQNIYAPPWTMVRDVIVVNIDITKCSNGSIIHRAECAGTGAPTAGTQHIVYSIVVPEGLSTFQRTGSVTHSEGSNEIILTYGSHYCLTDEVHVTEMPKITKGNVAGMVTIPLTSTPISLSLPNLPDGPHTYDMEDADVFSAVYAAFSTLDSACVLSVTCPTYPTVTASHTMGFKAACRKDVNPVCPGPDTISAACLNHTRYISDSWSPSSRPSQWLQRVFNLHIQETASGPGGYAEVDAYLTKECGDSEIHYVCTTTVYTSDPVVAVGAPQVLEEETRHTYDLYYDIGAGCNIVVNLQFLSRRNKSTGSCGTDPNKKYGVLHLVECLPRIGFASS